MLIFGEPHPPFRLDNSGLWAKDTCVLVEQATTAMIISGTEQNRSPA
ncbi:hypothetical protein [Cupriavidus necator]|nr:hypothetical protein [Cupriavidus necator]